MHSALTEQSCTLNNNSPLVTGTYDPFCGADVTLSIPAVGSFFSGLSDDSAQLLRQQLSQSHRTIRRLISDLQPLPPINQATTNDGLHILGASAPTGTATNGTFSDIGITVPTGPCPAITGNPLSFTTTLNATPLTGITPTEIDQPLPIRILQLHLFFTVPAAGSGLLPAYKTSATAGAAGTL